MLYRIPKKVRKQEMEREGKTEEDEDRMILVKEKNGNKKVNNFVPVPSLVDK